MASRMDRYKETELSQKGRSDRNKSLYKQIEDLDSYTNIAGIASIDNKNSIDLDKVRELLNRGKKQEEKVEEYVDEIKYQDEETVRNYDIKDILSKVKENDQEKENKHRSLSSEHYRLLKELNKRNETNKKLKELDEEELNELVKTISDMKSITDDNTDDVGLLDDLKSDTMVGDASSIKKIIDDEKELTKEFDTMKIDNSFYTSSFGFNQKDFEELKTINKKIKKDNKRIITLLFILIILIISIAVYYIAN